MTASGKPASRQEKQAAALRENLRRRKEQARQRIEDGPVPETTGERAGDGDGATAPAD